VRPHSELQTTEIKLGKKKKKNFFLFQKKKQKFRCAFFFPSVSSPASLSSLDTRRKYLPMKINAQSQAGPSIKEQQQQSAMGQTDTTAPASQPASPFCPVTLLRCRVCVFIISSGRKKKERKRTGPVFIDIIWSGNLLQPRVRRADMGGAGPAAAAAVCPFPGQG
jgi:hypothetical protein